MSERKTALLAGLLLLFSTKTNAQPVEALAPGAFLELVGRYHPVAQQAAFLQKRAEAARRSARGQFDPILQYDFGEKTFDGKNYYRLSEGLVRLPSWWGIEAQAGWAAASGTNLNPEEKLPAAGQAFAGLSASLWQGLLMDDRRAALARARNLSFLNETERLAALNDLLFEAGKSYWEWAHAFAQMELRRRFVELSQTRFEGVRDAARLGDRPMIDTLEAHLQVLERRADLAGSEADHRQAAQKLEVFLWTEDGRPQPLAERARPVDIFFPADFGESTASFEQNPAFRAYSFKIKELEIDRRLKREKLKPKLDLKLDLLADGGRFATAADGLAGQKIGVKFSWPLAARTARAELQLADIKLVETALQQSLKGQELRQKALFYQIELENTARQAALFEEILRGHRSLLAAEQTRFRLGESSIFLLNARENKLVETESKRIKLAAERQKALLGLRWANGFGGE